MSEDNGEEVRFDVNIFGVKIGTSSGWDHVDTAAFSFYDFEAAAPFDVFFPAAESLWIDYDAGTVAYCKKGAPQNGDGEEINIKHLLETLAKEHD